MTDVTLKEAASIVFADKRTELTKLMHHVCAETGVTMAELQGYSRAKPIALARQLAMWHLRQNGATLEAIGEMLGRDHTTVMHGVKKIDKLIKETQ